MKKFIITIDTEGDNLWAWKDGTEITTRNTYYLQRFQNICDQYGFKPVYLSNWEMLQNNDFVSFIKETLKENKCELGMHLHAWNTPPFVKLPRCEVSGTPYLIEFSSEIMEEKIKSITQLIYEKFGFVPISHRAGRWAMNDEYFRLLHKYGYKLDCSYTPGISWRKCKGQTPNFGGTDYRNADKHPSIIQGILEMPVTIMSTNRLFLPKQLSVKKILKSVYHSAKGQNIWLRPTGDNLKEMQWLIDKNEKSKMDYLMFMLHSSELMPGGSPTFRDENDIEILYLHLESIFQKIRSDYTGITLQEYYETVSGEKINLRMEIV